MSNEIQVTALLSCVNDDLNISSWGVPKSIDQAIKGGGLPGYLVVGTAEEDVDLSDLHRPGYAFIKNLGNVGTGTGGPTITYGPKSGGNLIPFGDLKEGEEAIFRLTQTYTPTLRIVSDDEETAVQLVILED